MTDILTSLSRVLCPGSDRPWLDALLAESGAIDSRRARLFWLLGGLEFLCLGYVRRLATIISPVWLACLAVTLIFAAMGYLEYEGLAIEDDLYPALAAVALAMLIGVSVINLRRSLREERL